MITLTAKINLLSGDNNALSFGSNNLSGNNISGDLELIRGKKQGGSNPFIIGASKLGDGSTFSNGEDYFISDQLSDIVGNFQKSYELKINSAKKLNSISISFDTVNNRHPKEITIFGYKEEKTTINETSEWQINMPFCNQENGYFEYLNKFPLSDEYEVDISACRVQFLNGEEIQYENFGEHFEADIRVENGQFYSSIKAPQDLGEYITLFLPVSYSATINKEIIDKNKKYADDDPVFTLVDLPQTETNNYLIKIDNWNCPTYPLVITGIYAEVNIDIDYRNLISISRSIFDRSDLKLPSFGIISNTGNIEFNDNNGEVRDYAEQLLLQSGLSCEIKLNNTLVDGASETIGLFETDQWNYDNDSRVVSVSIKDDLEEWQDINVEGILYDPESTINQNLKYYYEYLWKLTSNRSSYVNDKGETITSKGNYNMLSINELDEDTKAVLNNTYIQYALLESGSLWQQWTKICQVCQLHIYKNNNGVIVCRYNGGN